LFDLSFPHTFLILDGLIRTVLLAGRL
jgi:hypothetical protein